MYMKFRGLNGVFLLFGMLFLNACFSMTPEYQQPDLGFPAPENYQHGESKNTATTAEQADDHWWEAFGDPKLNQLVEDVLRNNWDIKQAAARVLETRYQHYQVRADRFPGLDVEGGYDRRKTGGGRIDQGIIFSNFDIGLAVAYERPGTKSCRLRKTGRPFPRQSWLKPSIVICKSRLWNEGYRSLIKALKPSATAWRLSISVFAGVWYQHWMCGKPVAFWPVPKPGDLNWNRISAKISNSWQCCWGDTRLPGHRVLNRKNTMIDWARYHRDCRRNSFCAGRISDLPWPS
jgi:hypothetical protein